MDPIIEQRSPLHVERTSAGVVFDFPVLRAPTVALGLGAFAAVCALMPVVGLAALLPLDSANASAFLSLALIGGFAAPFVFAAVVFGGLALYLAANSLHVEIDTEGARTVRRILGRVTARGTITRSNIADIEPRIAARYQNVFSSIPRYILVARHAQGRDKDVVVAEDLAGQALMNETRSLMLAALGITDKQIVG